MIIFHLSEKWIGINEFGHSILVLFKHQREGPEWGFNLDLCALSSSNKPLVGNTLLKKKKKK